MFPVAFDAAEAASLVLNYVTAYQMMHRFVHASAGQRALIHGAAGGVGAASRQLGRLACLEMYGTASLGYRQIVSDLGATPIDHWKADLVEEIGRLTGDGVAIVFDGVGDANVGRSSRCLRTGGRVIVYGFTRGPRSGRGIG
jgi:NADPH2:quinone reductase